MNLLPLLSPQPSQTKDDGGPGTEWIDDDNDDHPMPLLKLADAPYMKPQNDRTTLINYGFRWRCTLSLATPSGLGVYEDVSSRLTHRAIFIGGSTNELDFGQGHGTTLLTTRHDTHEVQCLDLYIVSSYTNFHGMDVHNQFYGRIRKFLGALGCMFKGLESITRQILIATEQGLY